MHTTQPCYPDCCAAGKQAGRPAGWMDASGKEVTLWQQMLDRPNFWVEGSVVLRPQLDTNKQEK